MSVKPNSKVAETLKRKYGPDYFANMGRLGGKASSTGGFYHSMLTGDDTHIKAGRVGGANSKLGHKYQGIIKGYKTWINNETGTKVTQKVEA